MFVEYNVKSDRQYFQYRRGYECRYVRPPIGLHSLILVSGGPESSPVPQATSTASTASTTPASPNPNSTPDNSTPNSVSATSHKLNVGAIAGGVVGGVAFVGILAGLIAFSVLRYRRRSVLTSPSTNNANALLQPMMSDGEMRYNATVPAMSNVSMTSSPGKLYVSLVQQASLISYPDGLAQGPQ